ncbi:hypothetical protein pb186bvf_017960 [Paramecium bursaria]
MIVIEININTILMQAYNDRSQQHRIKIYSECFIKKYYHHIYIFLLIMIFYVILSSLQFQQVYNQYSLLTKDFDQQTFISPSGIQFNQKGWNHIGSALDISQCITPYNTVSIYGVSHFSQGTIIYKSFDIPSHYQIQISFQFWIVDYQQTYQYKIHVDDEVVGIITEADLTFSQNLCGGNFFDSFATFTFDALHIGSSATIIITSTLDQQITTWGIRDFMFRFNPCPLECIQCQDSTSVCNMWQFQQEFWTTSQLTNSEGWNYNIGSFSSFQCIGQNFIKIQSIGDTLSFSLTLKPNYMFRLQFNLLKAGQFMGEQIIFKINTQTQFQQTFNNEMYLTQCSGTNGGDQLINFSQDYLYSQFNTNILQLEFSSDIQSTTRFYGLRNFYISIAPCIRNCLLCTTDSDCQLCEVNYNFDGTECKTTVVATPSIYTLYQSQQNIILSQFTQSAKTQCNTLQIYGGYQQPNTIQFNITDLPFHNQLRIKINIITIDKWQFYNTLQLFLDGQQYNIINRNQYDNQNRQNLCGSDIWNDNQYYIDILQNHYSSFLLIKLQFIDQATTQYFGVLDIQIDYYYCGPKFKCSVCDLSGTQCLQCSDVNRLLANNCECTSSPNIQSSYCPDCSQKVLSSIYCNNVDLCYSSQNYIPVCPSNGCEWGYTFDPILSQCFFDWLTLQDQYTIIQSHSIFNDPSFVSYNGLKFYDRQGLLLSEQISYCGTQKLLGGLGFNGKISMDFNDLPPYRRIRISYIIFLIDNDEGLIIEHNLNSKPYKFQKWSSIPKSQQLCGSSKPEFFTKIEYMIAVSGDFNFQISISNSINDNLLGSFGIYDINVFYQPCADQIKCSTCDDNGCLTCSDLQRIQSPQCDCPVYEYGSNKGCPTCPYKCQQNSCDILGCLQCANPSRGPPPDCLCSTYEVYGDSNCPLCQLNCINCTQNMCIQCETGYYSQGKYCFKCSYQCETCLQNGCLKCSDPSRTSAPFCRCPTYEIFGQSTCPLCPQNCSECNQQGCLVCNQNRQLPLCQCQQNYYEIGNQCHECQSICKTCDQYGCLTCHRQELLLPNCTCPNGLIDINSQCQIVSNIIKSYGIFDQSLIQIIISFDIEFIILGLENQQAYNENNCVIIKNSQGRCQIQNQKIFYQFDSSLQYRLDDIIEIEKQYFNFVDLESFEISPIQLKIDTLLNYYPQFNLNYPLKILQCQKYFILIEEVLNVGYQDYTTELIHQDSIQYSILNKTILFNAKTQSQIQIGIKITNFVNQFQIKMINVSVVDDYNLEFEVLPQIGQLNRHTDLYIIIQNIKLQNCIGSIKNFTKIIEINFNDLNVLKQVTNLQEYKSNINLGMLNTEQTYLLNITLSHQQFSNNYLKNYTINQIKPFFSIIGGNRMIYYNNRLNVSALIVDPDNIGLICEWQCLKLETNQDCGFNFTSQQYQLIERYQLELYQTYQFYYNCLGNKVYANYYVTDINEDQLFMFYPIIYSNYQQNQLIPLQFFVFNETSKNQLMPIQNKNIGIRIIQNQTILNQSYQENSFGSQFCKILKEM